jgi:actin related protein 2/3 complex subunit 2
MILLPFQNAVLTDTVKRLIESEKREPIDARMVDFDNVNYRIFVHPDDRNVLYVSMNISCWNEIKDNGAMLQLEKVYGDLLVENDTDNVCLRIDMDAVRDKAESLATAVGMLRTHAIGGPFRAYFDSLATGCGAPPPFPMNLREDTIVYFVPKTDRLIVIFQLNFQEKSDRVIAQTFLNEFMEAKRNRAVAAAPIVTYTPNAPGELSQYGVSGPVGLGFVSFAILKQHVDTDAKRERSSHLLVSFRNYLQYHIKCSKALCHQKMRTRVRELIKVLNRAKNDKGEEATKKTASGRRFIRS